MGVLRTLVLLAIVFLEVGKTAAAMTATGSFLQIDEVSTSIKPFCSPMQTLPRSMDVWAAWCCFCSSRAKEEAWLPTASSTPVSLTHGVRMRRTCHLRRSWARLQCPCAVAMRGAATRHGGAESGEKPTKDDDDY
jgi:hypothetical protein